MPERRLEPLEDQPVRECPACGEWIFPGDEVWTQGGEICCRRHMDIHLAEHLGWVPAIAKDALEV